MRNKQVLQLAAVVLIGILTVVIAVLAIMHISNSGPKEIEIQIPSTYDSGYTEDPEGYAMLEEMQNIDWETYEADSDLIVNLGARDVHNTGFTVQSTSTRVPNRTQSDIQLISMSENDAWTLITNGLFNSYPTVSIGSSMGVLSELQRTNTETITFNVWYWEEPNNPNNFNKVTKQRTYAVNSVLAETFMHVFTDIYNDPSQPVFNLADTGMGTWVLRGKTNSNSSGISAHAIGAAIDINPSTGSLYIDGAWYGNGYGQRVCSKEMWEMLPESHTKYHMIYDGCPIAEIFKSYGFIWGGDWSGTKDPMHFSFIGDGSTARQKGYNNYTERN